MVNNITIKLSEEDKMLFTESIRNGLDKFGDYKIEHPTVTRIGYTGTQWDYINTECSDALPKSKFDISVCSRGVWELILIYDKESKYLYTLMKDKRFEDLKKQLKKDKVHYLEAITKLNVKFWEESQEQGSFFADISEIKSEKIEKTIEQMLKDINEDIEAHILVTFTERQNELFSISASIVTPTLNIIYAEKWNEYIQPKYDIVINNKIIEDLLNVEEEDINLPLKEIEKLNNINIKLKKNEKNKEE
jgi:hypothetical protein